MRVVVLGATGNVGTAVVRALGADPEIETILGVARRTPRVLEPAKLQWRSADIVDADLVRIFRDADAVIHLAWLIQPSRDERVLRAVNVEGSRRVLEAVAGAGVPKLVYASSVGAYSAGPKDREVDEAWPTDGVPSSFYSRHKSEVERLLDDFEREHPRHSVVRMRPALIFRKEAAAGIRRLFLGPLFAGSLAREALIPVVPNLERLRFQAVHGEDVADAYRLALHSEARGAFNLAAEPVLDPALLSEVLDARPVDLPASALRGAASVTWRMRLQPSPPGWVDMALAVPLLDSARARDELGWSPRFSAVEALLELLEGLREGAGYPTPPLDPATSGPLRWREFRTGVGAKAI
jgi:UDP-glucose 4-epimerase